MKIACRRAAFAFSKTRLASLTTCTSGVSWPSHTRVVPLEIKSSTAHTDSFAVIAVVQGKNLFEQSSALLTFIRMTSNTQPSIEPESVQVIEFWQEDALVNKY